MEAEEILARYFECLNKESWDRMAEIWHEDCHLRAVGARPRRGRDEVVEFFSRLFRPWVKHEDMPTRTIIAGDVATVEVKFTGATHDGRVVAFEAVDVFDIQDGRIRSLSNWYDIDFVRSELEGEPDEQGR
jgi:ketosteroid isomerase-like protein